MSGDPVAELNEALSELLALGDRAGWVVSCYQKLEPGDRAGEKYRIKLKNRLRRAALRMDVLGFSRAAREAVSAALGRIQEFFRFPSNLVGGRGLAAFAANGFFRVVRLPHVLRSRVLVDRTPVVGELVALAQAGSRVLVVATDRRSARLFDVGQGGVVELEGIVAPDATRAARYHPDKETLPGFGEHRFHNRIREEKHRHLARVAEAAAAHLRAQPFAGLIVGGIGTEADALTHHLPPGVVAQDAVGVVHLAPRKVTTAEIRELVMRFLDERARRRAQLDVDEFQSAQGAGWATNGVEATLRALAAGRIRTLLVDHDAEVPGFRLERSGRLSVEAAASRGEGEPLPVADLLDDAIEDALRQGVRVAVARGAPARRFDRLAGLLRFRSGS
ncbi:MAG: hypothetical protein HY705_06560 [Gemmatimonadetes bacterium]|nr:hypothetical protein [Gemmatimonadota bacterium]